MDLILKNDELDEYREVKNGPGIYFLLNFIPFIGWIATLIISITRKQFKVWLSMMLIFLGMYVLLTIFYIIQTFIPVFTVFYIIFMFAEFILLIVLHVKVILHLNFWSYNEYIDEGYEVENIDDEGVEEFMDKSEYQRKPVWIFFL